MRIEITVEVDGTEQHQDTVLEELEIAAEEHEGIVANSGGLVFNLDIISVKQVAAGPRAT